MVVPRGSRCPAGYPKSALTKRSFSTPGQWIHSIRSAFTSAHEAGSCSAPATKEGRGKRYSKDCQPSCVYGMRSSRIPLRVQNQGCLSLCTPLPVDRNLSRRARRVIRRGDPCRSLFTFRVLCVNLPLDTVRSRSSTRRQHWPRRCRRSGHSTRVFGIGSQPSKDKCGNTLIFSLETKTSDIRVDSRVRSVPDPRSRSSLPSVVAETPFHIATA